MSERDIIAPALAEVAARLWDETGARDFDDLWRRIALVLPLQIREIPNLSPRRIENWYRARGLNTVLPCRNRALHGCLVAESDLGTIFLDAADSRSERRFTLAHEIAHFLLDYREPRRRALARFGEEIRPVLDGLCAPTLAQQLDGILSGVPMSSHFHLLEGAPGARHALIWRAEDRADALGLELIAPAHAVCAELRRRESVTSYFGCASAALDLLRADYDLPDAIAAPYSKLVARALTGGPNVLSSLGLV